MMYLNKPKVGTFACQVLDCDQCGKRVDTRPHFMVGAEIDGEKWCPDCLNDVCPVCGEGFASRAEFDKHFDKKGSIH